MLDFLRNSPNSVPKINCGVFFIDYRKFVIKNMIVMFSIYISFEFAWFL